MLTPEQKLVAQEAMRARYAKKPAKQTRVYEALAEVRQTEEEAKAEQQEKDVARLRKHTAHGVNVGEFLDAVIELIKKERKLDPSITFKKRSICYLIMEGEHGHELNLTNNDSFSELGSFMNDACELGILEDEYFVDTNRKVTHNSGYESVAEALRLRLSVVELDHWGDQKNIPIIMAEKDGHQGLLSSTTNEWQVRLCTSAGTWTRPSLIKIADIIVGIVNQGKTVHIGYVGDADPAGVFTVEATGKENLHHHLEKRGVTDEQWTWERIALTHGQYDALLDTQKKEIEVYDDQQCRIRPENYIKGTSLFSEEISTKTGKPKHAGAYIPEFWAEWGEYTAHVEVLGITGMRQEVKKFIKKYRDKDNWDASVSKSRREVKWWEDKISQCVFDESTESLEDLPADMPAPEPEKKEDTTPMDVCKWCGENIGKYMGWVHYNRDVDNTLEVDDYFDMLRPCEDGLHNAEPIGEESEVDDVE